MEKDLQNMDSAIKDAMLSETAGAGEGPAGLTEAPGDIETARREAREEHDKMLRIAAEFENYKKRMERERAQLLKYAEESLLKDLLPTLDNLERALEQGRAGAGGPALLEGVELTLSGFLQTLEKFGIKALDSLGQPFDPTRHDALCMEATAAMEPNRILKEFQKGYFYQDRLLRAAKVVVSQAQPPADQENKEI